MTYGIQVFDRDGRALLDTTVKHSFLYAVTTVKDGGSYTCTVPQNEGLGRRLEVIVENINVSFPKPGTNLSIVRNSPTSITVSSTGADVKLIFLLV